MKTTLVSIVIPVLNEERAVRKCVEEGIKVIRYQGIKGEVIVVDNGSTDRSREVAKKAGAKVINEPRKGYGRALLTGMEKASGEYLVIGDGDGSYDFGEVPKLLSALITGPANIPLLSLRDPAERGRGNLIKEKIASSSFDKLRTPRNDNNSSLDLVIGSRLKGKIEQGAMPFWHRYVGTPILNFLFRVFFKQKISDVNSGFRAITKRAFDRLKLSSTGMEFASEMLYKATKIGLKIGEVPISYHKRIGQSKLSPFRDAWRHLKFMLLFSSTYLFVIPGAVLGGLGLLGMLWLLPGKQMFLGKTIDIHTMTACAFLVLLGFQITFLGLFAKVFAFNFLEEENKIVGGMLKKMTLEKGIVIGGLFLVIGGIGVIRVIEEWWGNSFGALSQERLLLFSLTFAVLGLEIIFSSFFFGIIAKEER